MKSLKEYMPSMKDTVKIIIVTTVLAVTGIGAAIVAKASNLTKR